MNTIKSLKGKSAQGIVDYVEGNQERKGERGYYSENGKAPSQWQGRGAEMLGLSGTVDSKIFKELLEKGPPGMEAGKNRRMAAEIHWAPPKSVSMLIESAPPEMRERLLGLLVEANKLNMQHIEDYVVSARYSKGGAISEKTGCALIASYQHDDARPVKQDDGSFKIDMQHHFHNIIINATHDGKTWRAMDLDFGALSVEQHLGDFKAKAFLATELEKMGIATRKTKDGFEIAGITREQIEDNSGRGAEIEKALAAKGLTRATSTAAERNVANLDTRQSKIRDASQVDLKWAWRARLREEGVEFSKLYDQTRDFSKLAHESGKDQEVFNTERLSSTSTTEKEQQNEQRFFKHAAEKLHPDQVEFGPGHGMRTLSQCRLDATEGRESAGLLQDYARFDRQADSDLRREPAGAGRIEEEEKARQAINAALDHLSEKDSLFDRRQVLLESIKQGMGEVSHADIEAAMSNHSRMVWAGEQTKVTENARGKTIRVRAEMVTTVETVAREGWIQGFCSEGRGKLAPLMSVKDAENAVDKAQKAQGFLFADDQRDAVIATLTTEDRVSAMIGGAGTGKTTAMRSMVDAARAMGYETVGLTPSHGARQELLDAGTDKNVTTASFLMQKPKEDQPPRLYILDEAGMVGDRTMQSVLRKMGPNDRLLLSGDDAQTKPQEAGDPLKTLVDKGVISHCSLTKVQRQAKAEDKTLLEIGQAWADRDPAKALELSRKYMREVPVEGTGKIDKKTGKPRITTDDRRKAISNGVVSEFMRRSEKDKERTMIICPTNQVRGLVNSGIHEKLQAAGELPEDAIKIEHLTNARLSQAHMKQAHQYEAGQIMRTTEGKGEDRKTVDYEVVKADGQHNRLILKGADGTELTMNADKIDPKKWQVFDRTEGMGLAVGEKLIMRDNSIKGAQNGDVGKVSSITDGKITVQMERGQTIVLDANSPQAVDYGYARTITDSQGKSPDLVIESGEKSGGDSANLRGVAQTRMRHGYVCVTDHIDGYIDRALKYAEKNIALDARKNADKATDRRLDRLDSILENGKTKGAAEVEKQLHPERERDRDRDGREAGSLEISDQAQADGEQQASELKLEHELADTRGF